jgi:DNA-binding response OmpR family regulator
MAGIDILCAVRADQTQRYTDQLSLIKDFRVRVVNTPADTLRELDDNHHNTDVVVLDNGMPHAFDMIGSIRDKSPRVLIITVDEDADFALPGQADDISTDPFTNGDLGRRINRLLADRRLETLRADAMPPVRAFAKKLRNAVGELGKQEAAVSAVKELGYDYVAFYRVEKAEPLVITLKAQEGAVAVQAVAPKAAALTDIMGWVASNGQSKLAGMNDDITHPLVKRGRLGMVACVPVGTTNRYGVIAACRERPDSITMQDVLLIELIGAQLAAVISKE